MVPGRRRSSRYRRAASSSWRPGGRLETVALWSRFDLRVNPSVAATLVVIRPDDADLTDQDLFTLFNWI